MGHGDVRQTAGGRSPRGRRASRVLAWAGAIVAVVLVAGTLSAYALYRDLFGKIHQVKVTGLGRRPPGYDHSLNILVIGSDTRKGKNSRFGAHIGGQRSDTILVLHLSPGFSRAVVMSVPRDSVVPVLACPPVSGSPGQAAQPGQVAQPGQAAQPGQVEQINETFANGGPGCLWKTIEQTTRIRLDHFMELNFTGFEHVINDLGGVRICLPYPINDPRSKLHLARGIHHVMGAKALAYWRVRYIGVGSDLERIQRDQYLMASVAQEVKHTNLLGDPPRVLRLVSDIAGSLTTDSGLSQSAMITLVQSLRHLPLQAVHFVEVPVVTYPPNPNWVRWSGQAATLFRAIAQDRKLPRVHRKGHGRRAQPASPAPGGRSASPSPSGRSGSPAAGSRSPLSGLSSHYGGITAGANVCSDSSAFQGPLGGH